MLKTVREKFGPLDTIVIEGQDAQPNTTVVLCHGYGANAEDLAGIGVYLLQQDADLRNSVRFICPEAPNDLGPMGMPGGRAWWPINMAALAEINQTQDYAKLTELTPDGMAQSSALLTECIENVATSFSTSIEEMFIGGFSQGAMISTNLILRNSWSPARLLIYSGTVLCRADWEKLANQHTGCEVSQFHGRQDPVLPFGPAESLRDLLSTAGFDLSFEAFNGMHTIPETALNQLRDLLKAAS